MPTVIREEGFEVRIYTFDHHTATEIVGAISDRDVKRAERLVAQNAKTLTKEWTKIHGND